MIELLRIYIKMQMFNVHNTECPHGSVLSTKRENRKEQFSFIRLTDCKTTVVFIGYMNVLRYARKITNTILQNLTQLSRTNNSWNLSAIIINIQWLFSYFLGIIIKTKPFLPIQNIYQFELGCTFRRNESKRNILSIVG